MLFRDEDNDSVGRIAGYIKIAGILPVLILSGFVKTTLPTLQAQTCISTPVEIGYKNFNFQSGGVTGAPTEEKPQSKLWHNDGFWWGVLWDPDREIHRIHRFDLSSRCWTSVGPDLDRRPRSGADVLWDGTKLYVASSAKRNHRTQDGDELTRIYRFSYDPASNTYSQDVGFPVLLNNTQKTRGITIAKDSSGKHW
ncbi:hypothetical protein MJD09_03000, partial [bacterium]|nr:hypothetical protein [bacterium]